MKKSFFSSLTVCLICGLIVVGSSMVSAQESALFKPGPYLLIDDAMIASQERLERTIHPPQRLPEPIVTAAEDENFQPYISVARDAATGRFRMWYNSPVDSGQSRLATIESTDGIHWIRPHRVLDDPPGSRIQFGASVLDEGPDYANPVTRYKFGYYDKDLDALRIVGSADGYTWSLIPDAVVLRHGHDINAIFRDPIRKRYIAFVSDSIEDPAWDGSRRIPHQSVSTDLAQWREPWRIIQPEAEETGETQFYCISALLARGDLLVALVKVLRDDLDGEPGKDARAMGDMNRKAAGIGYTVLAWSRDGESWQRDTEPFFDRNREPETWDRAHAWIDCQVPVGDEVFLYYGGYARGHKVERFKERQVGLARMKRDRYVSRTAGYARGRLLTIATPLAAETMTINAGIDGMLRVRVVDAAGKAFAGFDWDDCTMLVGDAVAIPVAWAKPLSALKGKTVAFEFTLRESELYSFDLK
jgi:hypothetical protein